MGDTTNLVMRYTVEVTDVDLDAWADEYGIDRGRKASDDFSFTIGQLIADAIEERLESQGYMLPTITVSEVR